MSVGNSTLIFIWFYSLDPKASFTYTFPKHMHRRFDAKMYHL